MQGIFSPAVALLATLRFPAKFVLIALTILIPMGMLGFNIVSTQQKNTTFLQNQLKGIEYLEAIRPAIEYIPQHRGMYNAFRNGKTQLADKIQQRRQQVDQVFAEIDQINQRIGAELGLSSKFNPIKTHWESLKGSIDQQPPAKAFEDHTALIYELIGFILEVADQSGLILDPELDSYYMMDSTVAKLPAVTELLGRARGFASGLAAKGQATAKERASLTMQLELINQNIRALEHAMVVIYETAPHLKADFDSLAGPVFTASNEYVSYLTGNILNSDAISVDAKEVFDKGTQDISLAFKLYDSMLPILQNTYQQRHDDSINQEVLAIGMISAAVILVTYLFGGLYFSIMRNIEALNTAADHVADGDLTQQIELNTRDEMGQISEAMNSMIDSFRKLAGGVKASSGNLSEASSNLANISAEANQSMQTQWSQIDQVATAVNEMSATVADVSHHAAETANATTHVREQTESGKQVVGQAVQAVQALANEVQQTAGVIHKLEEDSENIGTVLDVIRGIAEQTNLLALNAAIEAARAGEQGRGFAVVADEVRTLAGRTQQSTEEIQEMIIALQSGANNAVKVMERGQSQVQVSVDQAARAQESLNAITDAVNNIADMSAQIATAAEEQSATTEEINRNVVSISEMAGKTADGAQQVANTTDQLAGLASQLQNQTQAFKV